ncbi:MAG TPA: DUF222 domain-containing protein [Kofleriaceae bacterium]|nr:DUF222 domain-containing protein [Kofleriaceae bacterium]
MAIQKTWQVIHRELTRLAKARAALDAEEAYWLREGHEVRVWVQAGFATYAEYLEGQVGYRRGTARERIRAALALGELPAMTEALSEGRIPWTAVRELSRVVTGDTEDVWLDAAAGYSVRQIEAMVAGLSRGDLPGAVRERGAERMCCGSKCRARRTRRFVRRPRYSLNRPAARCRTTSCLA